MRIAIFGTGAVGGYFGGRLAASGEDVSFVARGAHLAALQANGLRITSPKANVQVSVMATDDPSAIGPVDVVLFTVKLYDVETSARLLAPLVGPDTVVITLQNGVEAVEMVAPHVGGDHVAGGVAYIVAVMDEPGHVRHTTADRLVFGEADRRASARLERFQDAGRKAGFAADQTTSIDVELWIKFVRLTTWSGMTSATRSSMGVIRQHPELLKMMDAMIEEAIGGRPGPRNRVPRRAPRSDPANGAELPSRVEIIDARGPRARAPARAPLAERRCRSNGRGSRRCHSSALVRERHPEAAPTRALASASPGWMPLLEIGGPSAAQGFVVPMRA